MLGAQSVATELPTLLLPPGDNAWVVRIVTTGGFTGRGSGNLTASSAGEILCASIAACPDRLARDMQRSLSRLVTATLSPRPVAPTSPFNPGTCSDCVTTTMTVRRRDGAGERTFTYTWDAISASAVPDEALRLHAALIALVSGRSR